MTEKARKRLANIFFGTILLVGIAALSFPMFGRVIPKARISQATHTALQLKQAIQTFYTEYGRYPVDSSTDRQSSDHQLLSDRELMAFLMPKLRASAPHMSPRNIQFFSGREARESASGKYRSGIRTHPDGSKELLDPWGNHYRVIIDTDGDEKISPPAWTKSSTPIPKTVVVWSMGPDCKDETGDDNAASWK